MSRTTIVIAAILSLFPAMAFGQVTLLTPADQAQISSPPTFSWSGSSSYDAYYIQTYFYYEAGQFAGNYLLGTWVTNTSIAMPSTLWDKIGTGNPCYWRVLGFDVDSSQGAWSGIWSFEKTACPEPTGTTYEVDNVNDMLTALDVAGAGDMVRLAPGTYYPPVQSWTRLPYYSNQYANVRVEDGVILSGSGRENTTIVISGTGGAVFVYGEAVIRDVEIRGSGSLSWMMFAGGVPQLTLCNMTLNANSGLNGGYGFYAMPWEGGTTQIEIIDSSFSCDSCTDTLGIYLSGCSSIAPVTINANIQDTTVNGWKTGLLYEIESYGCDASMTVNYDCTDFFGNINKVVECGDSGCTELCP